MASDLEMIGPGSDPAQIANTINQNMQKLAADDTIKIWKDNNGVPQVLLGREGQGENPKFKVAQNGVDVTEATDDQLIMSSDFNMFKIVQSGEATLTLPGSVAAWTTYTKTVTHNLGYKPAFLAYVELDIVVGGELIQIPTTGIDGATGLNTFFARADVTTTEIGFNVSTNGATIYDNTVWTFKYYLMRETSGE